jgi:hypothetical protein
MLKIVKFVVFYHNILKTKRKLLVIVYSFSTNTLVYLLYTITSAQYFDNNNIRKLVGQDNKM